MNTLFENINKQRNGTIFAGVQTELYAISYPVVGMINGQKVDRFFLYPNTASPRRKRPFAKFALSAEDGKLLEYLDCSVSDFAVKSGISLVESINYSTYEKIEMRKLIEIKKEYAENYERIRQFAFTDVISEEQKEILEHHSIFEKQIIGDELIVFYRMLSPEYYEWKRNW